MPPPRAPSASAKTTTFDIDQMEQKYGIAIKGGAHTDPKTARKAPIMGREDMLLTPGQIRGFEAQREIRNIRKALSGGSTPTPLEKLRQTNGALHEFTEGFDRSTESNRTEAERLSGAAMQGHGLVHTSKKPGEVLLGSRSSKAYKDLAKQGRTTGGIFRTANVLGWGIERNDAFMGGALLGDNKFSVPASNPRHHYVDDRSTERPGRVTIREIAQVRRYATGVDTHAFSGGRYAMGTSQALSPTVRRGMHADLATTGADAQATPKPTLDKIPGRRRF